jgi:4-amino-4-deoxy-L-arabinose transferase-like glycosyltransferase
MMKPSRHTQLLVLILLLAAVLRLLWIIIMPTKPVSDFGEFDRIAASVATGQGYVSADGNPTTYRPPGYPLFLAGIYAVFGHNGLAARLTNVLLGVVTCFLTYLIAAQLFGPQIGLLAALIVAGFPSHILYGNLLATENLFIPLLLGAIAAFLQAIRQQATHRGYLILAGVLLGLATLVRPAAVLMPIVWGIVLLGRGIGVKHTLATISLVGGVIVAIIAPWTVRNAIVADKFIPVASEGGITFLAGHNERATEGHYSLEGPAFDELFAVERTEADLDAYAYKLAFRFIRNHPRTEIALLARKFYHFFKDDVSGVNWNAQSATRSFPRWLMFGSKGVAQAFYGTVAVLAILSLLFRPFPGDGWHTLLYALFIYWTAIHLMFYGKDRFRLPLMPVFAIFAAVTLRSMWDRRSRIHADNWTGTLKSRKRQV